MLNFFQTRWKTIGIVFLCGFSLLYFGGSYGIGRQVQDVVSLSAEYNAGSDPVTTLLFLATAENAPLSERNSAIWALGQLGNPQALSTLESLYSGAECQHETELCQHELTKAIKLCQGDLNISALVWRHGELALK